MNPSRPPRDRVLVTGALGPAGASLCRQLRDRGVDVLGVDMAEQVGGGMRTRRVPAAGDSSFVPALMRIVRDEHADLLIPTVSEELPVLAMLAETRPTTGARIEVGPAAGVSIANDKWLTYLRLAEAGVEVPRSVLPGDLDDEVARWLGDTVVAKPRVGRGGRDVSVHRGPPPGGLDDAVIVQEFVPGTEYAPNLYLGAERAVAVVLEKTALAHGTVGNAVEVRRLDAEQAPDVTDVALRAARALGLTGAVDLDIRRRADGVPVVLEVNARCGANSAYAPEVLDAVLDTLLARAAVS